MGKNILTVILVIIISFFGDYGSDVNKQDAPDKFFGQFSSTREKGVIYLDMAETHDIMIEMFNAIEVLPLSDYEGELDNYVLSFELYDYQNKEGIDYLQYELYEDKEHYYIINRDKNSMYILHKYYSPNIKKMTYR